MIGAGAVAAMASLPFPQAAHANSANPTGPFPLPLEDWQWFRQTFVTPEGRVVDTGNGGISHSEGQGYGMLLAAAAGARADFNRIWQWTHSNLMVRQDGLVAWKWVPEGAGKAAGKVTDPNNATDGDILIAWALLRAGKRWNDRSFLTAATSMAMAVRSNMIRRVGDQSILLPGHVGFERPNGLIANPSYWVFPALDAFARRHDRDLWRAVSDSGRALVARARFGEAGLPPDWVELAGTELRLPSGFETVFGFNAIRVPLYAIWGGLDDADALNRPVVSWWSGHDGAPFIPATVDLATDAKAPYGLSGGGRAVSVLTRFRGEALPMLPSIGDTDDYYSATLILLTKIAFSERFM